MPVSSSGEYIGDAIDSIMSQTFHDFELVLVIDPGTKDECLRIIGDYSDDRIRIIQNEVHLGLARSLNLGIDRAKGEYIARMDADDVSLQNRLKEQVEFLDSHQDIGVVGTATTIMDPGGIPIEPLFNPCPPNLVKWHLFFNSVIAHPTVMARKETLVRLGGYDPEAKYVEDYELWLRAVCMTNISNLPDILLLYRLHEGGICSQHTDEQSRTRVKVAKPVIERTVRQDVHEDVIKAIQDPFSITNDRLATEASRVLIHLKDHFLAQNDLSEGERIEIQFDVSRRLCLLAIALRKRDLSFSSSILLKSLRLRPRVLFGFLLKMMGNILFLLKNRMMYRFNILINRKAFDNDTRGHYYEIVGGQ